MNVHAFAANADLALALSLVAVTISTLGSGRRPRRARSWLFFSGASITLLVHATLDAFGTSETADASAIFEVLTLALFAIGFVLLYGADREHLRTVEARAERDATTGLLNRRAFREAVAARLRTLGPGTHVTLAVIDLDCFKQVNDSQGHPAGDQILELVAAAIRVTLRAHDLAARYGGDEFLVYLDDCALFQAERILQRTRTVIASVSAVTGMPVTASVGVASAVGPTGQLDDLIRAADRALIEVKRSGKNQLRVAEVLTPLG